LNSTIILTQGNVSVYACKRNIEAPISTYYIYLTVKTVWTIFQTRQITDLYHQLKFSISKAPKQNLSQNLSAK